jgi:hypothetical protein
VAIGRHRARPAFIEGFKRASQQQDRDVLEPRVSLDGIAHLVPVLPGHHHVGEDDVGLELARLGDRVLAVVDGGDFEVFVGEGYGHHLLYGDAVVRQ